ncbi:MAG: winged helix-turn-helix domain-containing protein [Calditrichaceae bacterium]
MINNIGKTAGQVYQVLEKNDTSTVAKLKTATKANDFILSAAIGWLARENKIQINQSGKSVKVSLL